MIKKLISSLFNKKEDSNKKVIYQLAINEANRILKENPAPSNEKISTLGYSYSNLSQIKANLRWNKIWQRGFTQAIYDKLVGKQIANHIDHIKVYSEFSRLILFYSPSSSINAQLENAIWELGYSSYLTFLEDGYMPF